MITELFGDYDNLFIRDTSHVQIYAKNSNQLQFWGIKLQL